jgi:Ni,Fe-hydrogenase III small subunit
MKLKPPINLAWIRFTSCSGCQLMLLNCESSLAELARIVAIHDFPLASSTLGKNAEIDIGLVEGSITTPSELERLLAFRRKVHLLVAVGACALTAGVNSLVRGERNHAMTKVYAGQGDEWNTFPPDSRLSTGIRRTPQRYRHSPEWWLGWPPGHAGLHGVPHQRKPMPAGEGPRPLPWPHHPRRLQR